MVLTVVDGVDFIQQHIFMSFAADLRIVLSHIYEINAATVHSSNMNNQLLQKYLSTSSADTNIASGQKDNENKTGQQLTVSLNQLVCNL